MIFIDVFPTIIFFWLMLIVFYLQTAGPQYEWIGTGLTSVEIKGLNNGNVNLSKFTWTYKVSSFFLDLHYITC